VSATALLIAFDGVLWRHDADATSQIESSAGLTSGTIRTVAFAPERAVPAMLGQVSRAAWLESVAAALADHVGGLSSAEKIVEKWSGVRGAIVPEVLDFIDDLRTAGVPVGVCATGIDELPADLSARVDLVVTAGELGISVPHPDFFATACRALAVLPKQCLYVDAAPRHIAGARAAGLLAFRYGDVTSVSYLREALSPR
jgi:putative hydrolase of the HAD superfamily